MITDKDKEEANGVYAAHLEGGIEYAAIEVSRIRSESAEQARKEAADRAVEFIRDQGMEQMEMWGEYDDNRLRAAILGDSVVKENLITDQIPDTGKKLAIAVKALESVVSYVHDNEPTMGQMAQIVENALKEIQG